MKTRPKTLFLEVRLGRWLWQPIQRVSEFIHCGRHGWAPRDVWALDDYLARVMGESLLHLAATEHGWPGWEGQTYDDWVAELRKHGDALLDYHHRHWAEEVDPSPTLHRLAEIWRDLWD